MDDQTINLSVEYLNRIADHCPQALGTYLLCCANSDDSGYVTITREEILYRQYSTYTRVCNDLRRLAREGLLEFYVTKNEILVTLADYCDL